MAVWLKGPNGSGKTTLLRMLATLSTPSCGTLEIFGLDVGRQREAIRHGVSLVSHSLYLYPGLTARETLVLWGRLGGVVLEPESVVAALDVVGLADVGDRRVGGFSAGMRKRLALARARIESPRLLLLDEPFSALDDSGCRLVQSWVREFVEQGGTVMLASHDPERATPICDWRVDLAAGQIVGLDRGAGR